MGNRSGYVEDYGIDDQWMLIRWRGAVAAGIRGKRGQQLLREMRDALDAMPDKWLIKEELVNADGDCCALGCVGVARKLDMGKLDPDDPDQIVKVFNVSRALVCEIAFENDDNAPDDPQKRWKWMRDWVEKHIIETPNQEVTNG